MPSVVVYTITVDDDASNAVVTTNPRTRRLKKNVHSVQFKSNDPRTVIRYRDTSPFAEAQVGPQTEFKIADAPPGQAFKARTVGEHHFDCGFMSRNEFRLWGGTQGADTPVDP
jgi:hypothetical protein